MPLIPLIPLIPPLASVSRKRPASLIPTLVTVDSRRGFPDAARM